MQTIVDLSDEQLAALRELCTSDAISETARDAIAALVLTDEIKDITPDEQRARRLEQQRAMQEVFGLWKGRNIDAVEYVRALRAEWDRD